MSKILIVDDNKEEADTLGRFFASAGHHVETAANGQEALVQVISNKPDAILLDLHMPEMDGPSFLEVIRSYLRLQALPVVVLTGLPESPMVDRARFLKVNSILAKGAATPDDILKAMEQAVVTVPG